MGNYQTKIVPNMPTPSQRIRDAKMESRYPMQGYRARRNQNSGINSILAYFD